MARRAAPIAGVTKQPFTKPALPFSIWVRFTDWGDTDQSPRAVLVNLADGAARALLFIAMGYAEFALALAHVFAGIACGLCGCGVLTAEWIEKGRPIEVITLCWPRMAHRLLDPPRWQEITFKSS